MKRNYENRERFTPVPGEIYDNAGGSRYACDYVNADGSVWFTNVKSGWHFLARGVGRYPDGMIDWDYSCMGRFVEVSVCNK